MSVHLTTGEVLHMTPRMSRKRYGSTRSASDDDIVSGRKYLLNKTVNCAAVAVFYIIHGIVATCQRLLLLHTTSISSVAGGEGNPLPEGLPRAGGHYTDGHYWYWCDPCRTEGSYE